MKKILVMCVMCLVLCGCSTPSNPYEKSVRSCLGGWKYWQENYYIQHIDTYEILDSHYIQGIPYVGVDVRIHNKYDPYNYKLFRFFVRKDYPSSMGIPQNKQWFEWIEKVKLELLKEIN